MEQNEADFQKKISLVRAYGSRAMVSCLVAVLLFFCYCDGSGSGRCAAFTGNNAIIIVEAILSNAFFANIFFN